MSRPLLRVFCPARHTLARVVAVRGVGPAITGDRTIKITSHTAGGIPTRDDRPLYRRTREPAPLASLDVFRSQCPCHPDPIPGQWLRDRLADGTKTAVWDWNRYATGNITPR